MAEDDLGKVLATAIELDDVDGPLTDDRTHVQASQGMTACGRIVSSVRCAEVGETVNCPECMAWLDEEEATTPARGTSMPATVEMTLEVDPSIQLWLQVTPPDGNSYRVMVPRVVLDLVVTMLTVEDPRRMSWKFAAPGVERQPDPSKG